MGHKPTNARIWVIFKKVKQDWSKIIIIIGKAHITNIKNEKDNSITDPTDVKKIRGFYKQFMQIN